MLGSVQSAVNGTTYSRSVGFNAATDQVTIACWFAINAFNSFNVLWSCDNGSGFLSPFTDSTHTNNLVIDHAGTGSTFTNWINFGTPPTATWLFLAVTTTTTSAPVVAYYGVAGQKLLRAASTVNFGGFPSSTLTFFDESAGDATTNGRAAELVICSGPTGALSWPQIEALYRKPRGELPVVPGLYAYLPFDGAGVRGGLDRSGRGNHFTAAGTSVLRSEDTIPLWTSPKSFSFLRANAVAGGGSNTPMTISATQTQTPSVARAVGLIRSLSQTQTASRARAVGRPLSVTQAQSTGASPTLGPIGMSLSATQTQTPTRARSVGRVLSLTASGVPSLARNIGRPRSATETQTPILAQSRALTLTVTQVQSSTVARAGSRALSAVQSQTPAMVRALTRPLPVAQAQTPTLARNVGLPRSATQFQTPSRSRALGRSFSLVQAQSPDVSTGGAGTMTLSAGQTQTPSLRRALARLLAATNAQAPSLTRALPRVLTATQAQTPSLIKGNSYFKNLSATTTQTPARQLALGRILATTQMQTPAMARALGLRRQVVVVASPSVARAIPKALAATQTQSASVLRGNGYFKTLSATQVQVPTRGAIALGRPFLVVQAQSPRLVRDLARLLVVVEHQLPTVDYDIPAGAIFVPADELRRAVLRYHPRKAQIVSSEQIIATLEIARGTRIDFDFDARPWLAGTALLMAFAPSPDAGDPVTYEPANIYGGKDVKLWASVPSDAKRGPYRVPVDIADDQGRTDRVFFQMRVL